GDVVVAEAVGGFGDVGDLGDTRVVFPRRVGVRPCEHDRRDDSESHGGRGTYSVHSPPVPLAPSDLLLTDRVAVVTGAAAGIGRAIASTFARFGADVAMCDRDGENLAAAAVEVEEAGRSALTKQLDVREAEQVAEFAVALR